MSDDFDDLPVNFVDSPADCFLDSDRAVKLLRAAIEEIRDRLRSRISARQENPAMDPAAPLPGEADWTIYLDHCETLWTATDGLEAMKLCEQIARMGRRVGVRLVLRSEITTVLPDGTLPIATSGSRLLSELIAEHEYLPVGEEGVRFVALVPQP